MELLRLTFQGVTMYYMFVVWIGSNISGLDSVYVHGQLERLLNVLMYELGFY